MPLNELEIEKQLTQRRLDIELMNSRLTGIQNNLKSLQDSIDKLVTSNNTVQNSSGGDLDSYSINGGILHKLVHTFQKAVTFLIALTVPNGGTGAISFTSNALLKGNGTGAIAVSTVTEDGTNVNVVGRSIIMDNTKTISFKDSAGTSHLALSLDAVNPDILHVRNNQRGVGGTILLDSIAGGLPGLSVDNAGNTVITGLTNSTGVYQKNGTQVVTARQTGWTAATGTPTRSTFATSTVSLSVLAEHVKALIDDLITHGLIGT